MWDNQAWSYLHRDREETEPPFLAQDFIHTVQPDAKIIIMLRDPVERYCRGIHPHTSASIDTDVIFCGETMWFGLPLMGFPVICHC